VNNLTYIGQKVPTLYSALTVGHKYASNELVYGHVNPYIIKHNDVVEIVINNLNTNLHPWHLHGHLFQVLERTLPNTGAWNGTYGQHSPVPVRRDTVMLQDNAYAIIRFKANNPGIWLLHCHIEFHTVSGFMATIIEAPDLLAEKNHGSLIPHDHIDACKNYPMKYRGNAAGNTRNPLDLKGANTQVSSNDHGYVTIIQVSYDYCSDKYLVPPTHQRVNSLGMS
jgi:iron transport multicopper oxidase